MPASAAKRFERFFAATSDCQFYLKPDMDGRFRYVHVNPAALSVTGRTRESDLIGLTPIEAMGEDYGSTVEQNVAEAYSRGAPFYFHGALGSSRTGPVYDATYIPLMDDDGQILGILGTARDVSDISVLNERLLHAQKLEALGELSGGVAHDFNNILAAIQGALRFLSDDDLDATRREFILKEANKSLEMGMALTKRLTSFARKDRLEAVPHNVADLILSCSFMMQRTLGKRTALKFDLDTDLWQACCDRNEFQIAMMNIATNARDATGPDGEVIVSARNKVRDPSEWNDYPAEYVEIRVRDNGGGMPASVAQRAIEPFFSTKEDGKGTGLGLSGIAKFVKDVGGAMRIESEVGRGTSVYLLLSRAQE